MVIIQQNLIIACLRELCSGWKEVRADSYTAESLISSSFSPKHAAFVCLGRDLMYASFPPLSNIINAGLFNKLLYHHAELLRIIFII